MARIRTIKPETPLSESFGRLSRDARLCFILLWTIVDDSGRTRAASRMLASLLFPYDDDAPKLMPGWLEELDREGSIRLYVVGEDHYLEIPKWLIHQKIDRPSPSKLPSFDEGSRGLANPRASRTRGLDLDLDLDQEEETPPLTSFASPPLGAQLAKEANGHDLFDDGSGGDGTPGSNGSQAGKPGNKRGQARPGRLPPDWQLGLADAEYARRLDLDPAETGAAFADWWHAKAGSGALKLDWSAAFRTWCRRARDDPRGGNVAGQRSDRKRPVSILEAGADVIAAIRRRS